MVGKTLGHYTILDKLGAGGMGEVYRAEDTTLDREVALKVLPPELAENRERLERFQREAKTLAALDHPNIVTVFTVEHDEDVHFLTMQLVEGKRLFELIPKGGMPLEQIFDIAIPLSDALAAAHEKGVIHRDLKPANIMLSDDGRVKILDFGLAKLRLEGEPKDFTELPTEPLTAEGRILGTMPYMSPEQLEGRATVDARSDIFSLGVILYEMATGERPFKGDSSVSLISSIVKDTPRDVRQQRRDLPNHLARIVNRCLNKKPERRFQSAKDLWNDLVDLRQETRSGEAVAATTTRKAPRSRWVSLVIAGALALAVGLIWYVWSSRQADSGAEFSFREVRLTANPENLRARGRISPDGRMLAFRDPYGVYVQDIDLGQVKAILGEGSYLDLGWHPDGRSLIVTEWAGPDRQDVWLVSLLTGEKELLQEAADYARISPDGQTLAFSRPASRELWVRSLPDGKPRILVQATVERRLGLGSWSPNGKRLAFFEGELRVPWATVLKTVDIKEGTIRELLDEPRLRSSMGLSDVSWLPTGRLLYALRGEAVSSPLSSLWSMPVDEEDGRPLGPAEMVKSWTDDEIGVLSVSDDGTRIGVTKRQENWDVYVGELEFKAETGGELRRITEHRGIDEFFDWRSSDQLLITSDRHRRNQLLLQRLDGSQPEILLSLPSEDAWPQALGAGRDWILVSEPLGSEEGTGKGTRVRRLSMDGRASEPVYELRESGDGRRFLGLRCPRVSDRPCILGEATERTLIFSEFDPHEGKGASLSTLELTDPTYSHGWRLSPTGTRLAMPVELDTLMIFDLEDQSQATIRLDVSSLQYLCWAQDEESIIISAIRLGNPEPYVVGQVGLDGSYEDLWTSHSTWFYVGRSSPDGQRVALGGNQLRSDVWMLCTDCPGD